MSRIITNDTVLTDTRTDRAWVDEMVRELHRNGEIFSPSDMTTGIHVTPDEMWELTPVSLTSLISSAEWSTTANPIFINGVPHDVREENGSKALESFMTWTTNDIAAAVAEDSIEYGGIQNEMGNHCMGYARHALVMIHEDTTQFGGVIPLMRGYRARSDEFPMLKPVRILVHNNTRNSIRPFEETPLTVRRMS